MGVTLAKGGNVSLSKAAPNLTKVAVGLGWDARSTSGADFDLDAVIESKRFANREKDRAVLPILLETLRLQTLKG